ncbi:hypothetical protein KR054_008341, partial [Drosophila jambulina]
LQSSIDTLNDIIVEARADRASLSEIKNQIVEWHKTIVSIQLKNLEADNLLKTQLDLSDTWRSYNERIASKEADVEKLKQEIEVLQRQAREDAVTIQELREKLETQTLLGSECLKWFQQSGALPSGCLLVGQKRAIQTIQIPGIQDPFFVLCDADVIGPGWTVIQRRLDGSVDFYRNLSDYRVGFGDLNGEFFIGLDKLHQLTKQQQHELFVRLQFFNGSTQFARYSNFLVGGEHEDFALQSIGEFSGSAGNALLWNLNRRFTTFDSDRDQ